MKKIFYISFLFFSFLLIPSFFVYAKSVSTIPIKILIVPGHDNEVWGAEYGNMKEADMTLTLATNIFNLLKKDKKFKVYITRDKNGYTTEFANYFTLQKDNINSFKEDAKKKFAEKVTSGTFTKKTIVYHNSVSQEVAIDLYGINKWANENKMDMVLHVHFNDYPRPNNLTIGKYKGFVIYMPETQMPNSETSQKLAKNIYNQLIKKYNTSTLPEEKDGLIPEQNLIALGAKDTLISSVRSVLIEYGYIYEKKFRKSSTRVQAFKDMANLTIVGIKNYFLPHP